MDKKTHPARQLLLAFIFLAAVLLGSWTNDQVKQRGGRNTLWTRFITHTRNPHDDPNYTGRISLFQQQNMRNWGCQESKEKVVFLGDSLTQANEWQAWIPEVCAINMGIGGDTSEGVLKRLHLVTELRPTTVILTIGTNDAVILGYEPEGTYRNWEKTIHHLRTKLPRARILLCGIPPRANLGSRPWAVLAEKNIRRLGADWLDLGRELGGAEDRLPPKFTTDGLHLRGEAYAIWVAKIRNYLNLP